MKNKKRIGFIAMSGVRAHNAELTKLGLTLPGFVDRNKIIASLPSLGLLTLAGLTPDKFEITYHEIADLKKLPELPVDFDLVAIGTFTAQFYEACGVADFYRARKVPVIMGGITVFGLRDLASKHCTSVVIGEGELLWPEVLNDFECGTLKPFYATTKEFDFAAAPMPRFSLLNPEKYNRLTVQTSRGCPHSCDFCASSILLTPRYKVKPVEKVVAEIREIKKIWPRPFIEFADDNSFARRDHSKVLLRQLAKENFRWFTEADIGVAKDEELLCLMRDSGCQQVLVGLESPCRKGLDKIELKSNWKQHQLDFYKKAIAKIQSYGITVNGCFILGLDGDTRDIFGEILDFVRESSLYEVQVTFMTAFPGTPLYERLKKENRIIRDDAWELCTLFDINFLPKNMNATELQNGFLKLVKELYSAKETRNRRSKFKRMLKTSPNFGRRAEQSEHRLAV
ncbi:MAG: radical SAM protein [Limisphaerales bacterium]